MGLEDARGGSFPEPPVFEYLMDHFLEEPARSRFARFWRTADAMASLPNRDRLPSLPQAYAHCLRSALDEIWKSGDAGEGRWTTVSRDVTRAHDRYESARNTPDELAALTDMLASIEALDAFHRTVHAEVRGLTNLVFEKTGARFFGINPHPAKAFRDIKQALAKLAHSNGSWTHAFELRDLVVGELALLFRPPTEQFDGLQTLAHSAPSIDGLSTLINAVTNEHHLRLFLSEIRDFGWIQTIGTHELLAPSVNGGPWAMVRVVDRFGGTFSAELADWLSKAYKMWRGGRTALPHSQPLLAH